jgi:membrane protease YdiL (CAAX protease family)
LLIWLMRKEGIRLRDLFNFERSRLMRDLLFGLGLFVPFTLLAVGGGMISALLIYGTALAPEPFGELPLWGALYGVLVWPIIWSIAEQMTYQGYALPRLELITGRAWLAIAIVGSGWAIQHCALPFRPDWQWILFRFASSLPIGIVLPIIYLRTRRLLPFIVVHWAANFASVLMFVLLPMIKQ